MCFLENMTHNTIVFFAKPRIKLLITVPCPKKSNIASMPCPFAYILFVFLAEQNYPRIYFYHVKKAEENFGPYLFNKVGVFKSRLAQKIIYGLSCFCGVYKFPKKWIGNDYINLLGYKASLPNVLIFSKPILNSTFCSKFYKVFHWLITFYLFV